MKLWVVMNLKLKKLSNKVYPNRPFNTSYIGKNIIYKHSNEPNGKKLIMNECKYYNIIHFRFKKLTKHGYRRRYDG